MLWKLFAAKQTLFYPVKIAIFGRIAPNMRKILKNVLWKLFVPLQTLFYPVKIAIFCRIVPNIKRYKKLLMKIFATLQTLFYPVKIAIFCRIAPHNFMVEYQRSSHFTLSKSIISSTSPPKIFHLVAPIGSRQRKILCVDKIKSRDRSYTLKAFGLFKALQKSSLKVWNEKTVNAKRGLLFENSHFHRHRPHSLLFASLTRSNIEFKGSKNRVQSTNPNWNGSWDGSWDIWSRAGWPGRLFIPTTAMAGNFSLPCSLLTPTPSAEFDFINPDCRLLGKNERYTLE